MLDKEQLKLYLEKQHMMQLASSRGSQPWCCTVYFVFDDDLNLYWASLESRRHSQEISFNHRVSAAIAINFTIGQKVVGVQVQGTASKVIDVNDLQAVSEKYAQRFNRDADWVSDMVNGITDHKIYMLKPELYVLFDEVNYPDNPRQELKV